MDSMKVALVHDWLTGMRGGEKCLEVFCELFPEAPVLLLVRDGRSVGESLHTGFRRSYTGAIKAWRAGAREIAAFARLAPSAWPDLPWRIVRYEDLVADPAAGISDLLDFLRLDPAGFDAERAPDLPVYGSSFVKVDGGLTWQPVEKDHGFDPTTRFDDWPPRRHDRFAWLAGREHEALGYDLGAPRLSSLRRAVHNVALGGATPLIAVRDAAMRLRWGTKPLLRRRRRASHGAPAPDRDR